jgi:hypothetical protein
MPIRVNAAVVSRVKLSCVVHCNPGCALGHLCEGEVDHYVVSVGVTDRDLARAVHHLHTPQCAVNEAKSTYDVRNTVMALNITEHGLIRQTGILL